MQLIHEVRKMQYMQKFDSSDEESNKVEILPPSQDADEDVQEEDWDRLLVFEDIDSQCFLLSFYLLSNCWKMYRMKICLVFAL